MLSFSFSFFFFAAAIAAEAPKIFGNSNGGLSVSGEGGLTVQTQLLVDSVNVGESISTLLERVPMDAESVFVGSDTAFYMSHNAKYDAGWKYVAGSSAGDDGASSFKLEVGAAKIETALPGTAGNAVSWNRGYYQNPGGNVTLGSGKEATAVTVRDPLIIQHDDVDLNVEESVSALEASVSTLLERVPTDPESILVGSDTAFYMSHNGHYKSGWKYIAGSNGTFDGAANFKLEVGGAKIETAVPGFAGDTIKWNRGFYQSPSGDVTLGCGKPTTTVTFRDIMKLEKIVLPTCDSTMDGALAYSSDGNLYFCKSSAWVNLTP